MKKKNVAVYIDGENIPAKESRKIFEAIRRIGEPDYTKVYGIQKDQATKAWSDLSFKQPGMKDIRLSGGPGRNKVDKKIKKDIERDVEKHTNIETVVIVTSDHGYASCVREMRAKGKRVVGIGRNNASPKLKESCSLFINL